jgi:DNA polymerase III epsilon subunit-like protein
MTTLAKVEFRARRLALTDLETTGVEPRRHEIIEIGLIVVDQVSLEVIDTLELKVKPEHIETAAASALAWNGYNEAEWASAVSLKEAMLAYANKTRGAVFCSHNVTFDWAFLSEAFDRTGVTHEMDYHRIDLFTVAWARLDRNTSPSDLNLDRIASHLGIECEPMPHRAMNGAWTAYRVLRALLEGREESLK